MTPLNPCPCGNVPARLDIVDSGQGPKYSLAVGDCCGEWHIEFRSDFSKFDSPECMALAREAWNAAPRGEKQ